MSAVTYSAPCPGCGDPEAVWIGFSPTHYVAEAEPKLVLEVRCAPCDARDRAPRG